MRPIKFRAWDDGKMVYEKDIDHISMENTDILRLAKFFCNVRNDSHIMQFTGLLDKHGKEIYEGDILKWYNSILEVRWGKGEFIIWSKLFKSFGNPDGGSAGMINARNYFQKSEVIGNVYENPELVHA